MPAVLIIAATITLVALFLCYRALVGGPKMLYALAAVLTSIAAVATAVASAGARPG